MDETTEIDAPNARFEYDLSYDAWAVVASFWSLNDEFTAPVVAVARWSGFRREALSTHYFYVRYVRAEDGSHAVTLHADPDLNVDRLVGDGWVGGFATDPIVARRAAFYGMWSRGMLDQPAFTGSGMLPEVLHPTLEGWKFLTGAACPAVAVDERNAV